MIFTVNAVDTIAPIINGCPDSQFLSGQCGTTFTVATWIPPTATDNSGGVVAESTTHQPGTSFPVGATPVTYTFTDSAGNQAQCIFTITGNNNEILCIFIQTGFPMFVNFNS